MENSFGFGSEDVMEAITTTHLALIVLFAILVILAIWWGVNRRRDRRRAEELARERREEAGSAEIIEGGPIEPPVAPPPPPLADVPIPASAPQEANPAALAVDEDAEPARSTVGSSAALGDGNVTMIKGLGPKVAARLAEHGITRVDQLAALSEGQAAALDAKLGNFSGRMARDRWIEQARLLAAGDREGFEATFGKLG